MGKAQKKTGKGRLDKYYKLAKEQGYRARSAFKLIQLNKKYSFLESARCCIDLCAAPGGWLQVASKYMPPNSLIVGVDLVPIKPIPRVSTFATDITTPQCRNFIRSEIKDWKADVVLHDGAPNVGTAWIQDAYSQSELVLMSMKLAVEFLVKGGTFVTKVFRSADYNNLIWVFTQLFGKVEATKPPSSRNVSAEIFVVCRDFLAPKHIDPKFLDPRHVFKDLAAASSVDKGTSANNVQANVFHPEKNRRKRGGYDDGDYTLHKKVAAGEFIRSSEPIAVLGSVNQITFDEDEEKEWLKMAVTTPDVKANCDDLKVLGKGDFKALLKWRILLREEIGLDLKEKNTEDDTEHAEVTEVVDEEQQISEELERLTTEAAARTKRARRRANEIKTRAIQRMQLKMVAPLDIGLEQNDASLAGQEDFFDLGETEKKLSKRGGLAAMKDTDALAENESEEEEEDDEDEDIMDEDEERERKTKALEDELDGLYTTYQDHLRERDSKFKVREARSKNKQREEWGGVSKPAQDSDDDSEGEEEDGGWERMQDTKYDEGEASSGDSESEDDEAPSRKRPRLDSKATKFLVNPLKQKSESSAAAKVWFNQSLFDGLEDGLEDDEDEEEEDDTMSVSNADEGVQSDNDDDMPIDDDFEVVPLELDEDDMWDVADEDEGEANRQYINKYGLVTAEAMTLAQQLVNHETTRTKLINDGFNRYSMNSKDDLPTWFLDDESKHYKPNLPVTKEAMAALRAKQRALDARPIKKIAEAKARKKLKAHQRLEKAMKKAEGVNTTEDLSEKEKAQQIEKLMRKGLSSGQKVKKDIKVVVARGAHKGVKGRPKGVKGRYSMVDARMRKETRAKKRVEKANKKRKRN